MGITSSDVVLIEDAIKLKPDIETVIELGSQNLYLEGLDELKPPFASEWYKERNIKYRCIDMAGDNKAMKLDLSRPMLNIGQYDLVTDFGTAEHVVQVDMNTIQSVGFHNGHINSVYPTTQPSEEEIAQGFYNCWRNKHNLMNVGGILISVNPKTGSWRGHGYTYLTTKFYEKLAELMNYNIILLRDHAAMGNTANGWNVECMLSKKSNAEFVSFEDFQQCEQLRS